MNSGNGKWFANRAQVVQVIINVLMLLIGVDSKKAFKELMDNQYFAFGPILFYVLIALVVVSFIWSKRAAHGAKTIDAGLPDDIPSMLDQDRLRAVLSHVNKLSPFEILALRHLVQSGGMTGNQFSGSVQEWGFPIESLRHQRKIQKVFQNISDKTMLLSKSADSDAWRPNPENQAYIDFIVSRLPLDKLFEA